jgi:hypothetical protein
MKTLQGHQDIGSQELSGASLHFDLGVDVLAFPSEIGALPNDWQVQGAHDRGHNSGPWVPNDPRQMQVWAATLDVPGL